LPAKASILNKIRIWGEALAIAVIWERIMSRSIHMSIPEQNEP
jgi:hypothetical protein